MEKAQGTPAAEVVDPQIAPGVEIVGKPIATSAKLAPCERAIARRTGQARRPDSEVRLETDEPRRVFNHDWLRNFESEKSNDALARDPIRSLGKANGREAAFVNVVEDRRAGQGHELCDFAWGVERLRQELR